MQYTARLRLWIPACAGITAVRYTFACVTNFVVR